MLKRVFEQLPPGSFTYEDAEVIVRSLNRVKSIKGDCLEIGSDLGRSSTLIAEIIKENSHLFCVDIWSNETWNELASQLGEKAATYPRRDPKAFEIFRHNIKKRGLNAVVTPLRNKSEEAIKEFKNPLKFIFIDGCHEYEYVKKDIEWVKYLVEGGEVVFHDYTDSWPDVKAAVNEFASNHSFKLVDSGGNCICFRKRIREHSVSSSSEQPLASVYSSSSKRIKIAAVTMVYNEALLLPYFIRHYEYLDEIYVLYETDSTDDTLKILKQASNVIIKNSHIEGGLDSIDKVNLINNTLHTIKADWVYVVDCDEFIFPPQESPNDFLSRQDCENYNVVRAGMFQVYRHRTDKDLDPSLPPIPQRVHGDPDLFSTVEEAHKARNAVYVKPIVVKPSSEIWFQPGNHVVEGDIRVSPELYMGAHWQMADPSIAIDRRMKNKARMSERNKRLGMGWQHWDITEEWIRAGCDCHLDDPLIDELYLYSDKNFKNYDSLMRSKTNMKNLNPWNHLICFVVPNQITPLSAWHEHIPFAMFLVDLLRPKMIVELGTHYGDSYCAFCQAVKELHLDTACYAVDTWRGDPQSGLYGPEVLADLRAHHDPLYSSFSRLIQSTFDEALEHFADGTVDLLHIDGYHTYESVRHDFEAWLPKMSQHSVVLFHDTNVREQDFGIRKFWDEVKLKYPHFEFRHGHGLGVLAVGKVRSKKLQELFKLPEEESIRIRDFFFQLGHQLTTRVKNKAMASELENQKRQLQELNADLESKGARIANLETSLQEKVTQIHGLESQIHGLESQIHSLESQIHSLEFQIQLIEGSIPMQLLNRYQRIVERLLRLGTRRRRYYELGLTGIRVILNEGWRSFFRKVRIWFPSVVWQTGRAVYHRLPVSISTKAKLVRFVMKYGGRFFQNVGSYRQWKQLQEREPAYKLPSPYPGFYDASKREHFNFPDAPSPVVSVIIPVHNKSKYTYACLYSIYENRPDVEFEVIVVDDCSTDDTQDLLKTIGGIQVIHNVTNLGFAGSVNCGAEVARGEYLLILNNDTLVHPGWMDELFAVMSSQPDIGLVGSQLIYPDGRLQESGCLMCQDGCAVPLGRFKEPLHPEFSYFREVDFCSAASILVRRKKFHKVGGLSTAYAPAYFEDVDFAFKLREIGKRVFVQPLSKVTHYEAVSYSRELSADLIARNRRIFVEKWQRVLQQCSYASVENFRTTPNYNHKRVLYIDLTVPVPDRGAGSVDAFWYMRFLVEAGYDVMFYGEHTPTFVPKYTPMIQRIGVQCLYLPYIRIERYLSEHGSSFSHVFVARVYQAMSFNSLIRRYCPNARYIFNTVDVHFLREMRQAEVEKSPAMLEQAKQTRERELGIMEQADATIVVSTEEKELLEREYDMKRIYHVPLAREVYGSKHPFRERRDLVFIGSSHLPNVDATYYFHSEIFPLIQRELPDVKFIVIGEYLRDALKEQAEFDKLVSDPSVKLVGFVEDLSEYFDWIRVMVAPLRYGSGVKGKIITGFQYGVPCVSTSIGLEGIGLTPEFNVLQADDSVSFARAVVRLYTDQILWERLSENCMMFTREHFSEQIARRELLRIITQTDISNKEVI